ncbi:MAG: flagellar motor protein MotB [Flavobacteriales bacterium]|jgi:flagellar motor protein MotB
MKLHRLHLRYCLTIAAILLAFFASAQDNCEPKVSKKSMKTFFEAQDDLADGDLKSANSLMQQAIAQDTSNLEAIAALGDLFARLGNDRSALKCYKNLVAICENYSSDIYFKIGELAVKLKQHSLAIESLERYLSKKDHAKAQTLLDQEKQLKHWYEHPVPYQPKPLQGISTKDDEYLACITADERQVYFTRRYQKQGRSQLTATTVEEFTLSTLEDSLFNFGAAMEYPFNRNNNEGGPSLTATNTEMYLTICEAMGAGGLNCDIFYAHKKLGNWTDLKRLPSPINDRYSWESQPSISADGKTLYFVSSRAGGEGGLDIYRTSKAANGIFGKLENLGPKVNTNKDDKAPFIHSDSQTLYFASQGHFGLGNYDIYKYNLNDSTRLNLGYPINTKADELGLFVSLSGKDAFFASNQLQGNGGWDLYRFSLYKEAQPKAVFMVRGRVDNPSIMPKITLKNLTTNESKDLEIDSISGDYLAILSKEESPDYIITIARKGYAFNSQYINYETLEGVGVVDVETILEKVAVGDSYPLKNIRFSTDSYALNRASIAEISAFGTYLISNTNIHVSIEGHTDNVGGEEKNLILSKNRAKAVMDQLKTTGVASNRLKFKGYGASKAIDSNATDKGRALNRRTVFVIDKN